MTLVDVRQNIFEEKTQTLIAQKFCVSKLIIKFQNTPICVIAVIYFPMLASYYYLFGKAVLC